MIRQHIRQSLDMPFGIVAGYLGDLTDADFLVRATPGTNHIAWQLGHLICSERHHMEHVRPGCMPPLPDGFQSRYTKETSGLDDPQAFDSKARLMEVMQQQRSGTIALLESLSDEQLAAPAPEAIRYLGPLTSSVFFGDAVHWTMHAGQWAIIRRLLGRPPLF